MVGQSQGLLNKRKVVDQGASLELSSSCGDVPYPGYLSLHTVRLIVSLVRLRSHQHMLHSHAWYCMGQHGEGPPRERSRLQKSQPGMLHFPTETLV